jgi:hypothetical protein
MVAGLFVQCKSFCPGQTTKQRDEQALLHNYNIIAQANDLNIKITQPIQ